jgi:uncharacterized membrane protein
MKQTLAQKEISINSSKTIMLGSFLVIFILGFFLRFYGLSRDLGDGDEAAMLLYFGFSSFKYIAANYFDTNNHILHTLLVHLMTFAFGEDNEIAIRLPGFIFGLAGIWMIYVIAKKLFGFQVAIVSLLIASLSPVHILYSQTARGYSLIIFFSLVMFYSTLKVFETKSSFKWGIILVISGFLSIYTIPTNVYFSFALFFWTISVLLISKWSNQYQLNENKKKWVITFIAIYFLMALVSLLAYWNLLDQIPQAIQSNDIVQTQAENTSGWKVFLLMPDIFALCFQGPQIWFTPFILLGIIGSAPSKKPTHCLPIFVFFLPFLFNLFLGYSGFTRNYLFNWPFLIIFLAAGLVVFANFLSQHLPYFSNEKKLLYFLLIIYSLLSLKWLSSNYYPEFKNNNQGVLSNENFKVNKIEENDLIIIQNPKQYLFARSLYKKNLSNIILKNNLGGVKMIAPKNYYLSNFQIKTESKLWKIFDHQIIESAFKRTHLNKEKDLIYITTNKSSSVFTPDFETKSDWKVVSGEGKVSTQDLGGKLNNNALSLKASLDKDFIIQTSSPINFDTNQAGLLILIWTMKRSNSQIPIFYPTLTFQIGSGPSQTTLKLPFGKINEGINVLTLEDPTNYLSDIWSTKAIMGKLPPGKYAFHLWLKCHAKNAVLYDNLRLFFIPTPIDLSKGFGGP